MLAKSPAPAATAGLLTNAVGDIFGKKIGKVFEDWSSQNAGFVKSVTPLVATITGLSYALSAVKDHYIEATQSAQAYEKSVYGTRRAQESQLSAIRDLQSTYATLQSQVDKVNRSYSSFRRSSGRCYKHD